MVGQGYDGASSMSGQFKGVQTEIRKQCPIAAYVHCSSHCLNLSLSKASSVQAVRNTIGTMSEVITFINSSAKRLHCFIEKTRDNHEVGGKQRLKRLCETRWVERHEAVARFHDFYEEINKVLEEISKWHDATAASKARSMHSAILKHDFVVSLLTMQHVLAITKPVAERLQTVEKDLVSCVKEINNCIDVLKEKRENVDSLMTDIAEEAEKLLLEPLEQPRTTGRQRNRANVSANSPEEYFKRSIVIPYLDGIVNDLSDRFDSHSTTALKISCLLPSHLDKYKFADLEEIVEYYQPCVPIRLADVRAEYERWCIKWKNAENRPICPADALRECDINFYPAIHAYLKINCCLPATTATAERSFSTLKYLKNYLRSTTLEDRLNGLTRLYIHKDIDIDIDRVIDTFAMKKRRCDFVLPM